MGTEINKAKPFSAEKAVDAIRERIRGALADLIPDEQWDTLIRAEVKDFLEDRTVERNSYRDTYHQTVPAGFKRLVREELTTETKNRLKTFFDSPEWTAQWENRPGHQGGSHYVASEEVKRLVLESSGQIISSVLSQAIQNVVTNMRGSL